MKFSMIIAASGIHKKLEVEGKVFKQLMKFINDEKNIMKTTDKGIVEQLKDEFDEEWIEKNQEWIDMIEHEEYDDLYAHINENYGVYRTK